MQLENFTSFLPEMCVCARVRLCMCVFEWICRFNVTCLASVPCLCVFLLPTCLLSFPLCTVASGGVIVAVQSWRRKRHFHFVRGQCLVTEPRVAPTHETLLVGPSAEQMLQRISASRMKSQRFKHVYIKPSGESSTRSHLNRKYNHGV